jgi:hypothetical protein
MSEAMSQETFAKNNRAIRAGLAAVISNPKSRRRWRLLPVYEKDTGELLAEVFDTLYGPVIWHRSWGRVLSRTSHNTEFTRQGRSNVVVAPLTDDPDQRFRIVGRKGEHTVAAEDLRQSIAEGQTRHAV